MSESEFKRAELPIEEAIANLWALETDCCEAGWDGASAAAIDRSAILNAQKFALSLPAGFPAPEFSAEPDGSVALDWIESRNRIFSISISAGSHLAYAWLDGSDKGHGVAQFDGEKIPARVLEGIHGILSNGDTAFKHA
jgi:hypothetical protein